MGDAALDLVTFYSANLAVPARRDVTEPPVLRGEALFHEAGCAACRRPSFVTHRLAGRDKHSSQLIRPTTDLLRHDMGEGLADGRRDGARMAHAAALGRGAGPDGVARGGFPPRGQGADPDEAVLWHGGEAQPARNAVAATAKPDRDALIRFLESL
ncbi:Di-haem oxidoreductase, putative peroxidase [Rubrimonas cliftonensis]|uniref:Di-haem oxidoreductase, putative peroxidase n=1 Tax=Rubrimonas cliftonensis TaxID=89524 RepID=A0A1H4DK75_9RHOB|nr:Di-haem oxidoreductase, putative peroxidase [Rubrimonas cliftonensis]